MTNPDGSAPAGNPNEGATTPAGGTEKWYGGFKDEGLRGFVENKGFQDAEALAGSYLNLEKLFGHDKAGRTVVLPKDDKDAEGLKTFRSKLGVPEKPEEYEIPVPEGGNDSFAKVAKAWFHEIGIPRAQAKALGEKWNEHISGLVKTETEAQQKADAVALEAIKKDWGSGYDVNVELAKRAAKMFSGGDQVDEALLSKIESAMGTADFLKAFHRLGTKLAEDEFVSGKGPGFKLGKEGAQARKNQLMQDKLWTERWVKGDADARKEMEELNKILSEE